MAQDRNKLLEGCNIPIPGAICDFHSKTWPGWIAAILMVWGSWYLGARVQQQDFFSIAFGYGFLFLLYAVIFRKEKTEQEILFYLIVGILCRAMLLFSLPLLSDDYFRFIWDGRLILQGIHPFVALPSEYAAQGFPLAGLDAALYEKLNSPEYYTVYPPVAQAIFATACFIFPQSIAGSVWVMKLLLFLMEIGSVWLLWRLLLQFGLPLKNALLYALNPLVIIEITGNLHFEGAMIFFFLLALWLGSNTKLGLSAGAMALSVASKMLSLLALPFLLRKLGLWPLLRYYLIFGLATALLFFPLFNEVFVSNFGKSLNLYFRQFEFNASLYYIGRWIVFLKTGYNRIDIVGPVLAVGAGIIILGMAFFTRHRSWAKLPESLLFAICTYLFCTTTVHPWYLCLPVVLSVFSPFRFAIIWSALAVLSYQKYQFSGRPENLWITGAEYVTVYGVLVWELLFKHARARVL